MRFPLHSFRSARAALLLCLLAAAPAALAQRVFWADAGSGDPADIQLVFENCKPSAAPDLPALHNANFHYRGQSTQVQVVNFSRTSLLVLSYRLHGISTRGEIAIPSFIVQTDQGELSVPAYTTGTVQPGPEADIKARLTPRKTTVWAGEVFPLVYSIDVARRNFSNFGDAIQWDAAPLVAEDWAEPAATESLQAGESRLQIGFATRAYAQAPGPVRLNPVRQLVNLNLGLTAGGFGFFQQQRIEQVGLATNQAEIQVQPLPLPAPANYIGAVGDFTLESKVVPQTSTVGEPITWTLTLSGTGNWPDIAGLPPRSVSADFQALQPPAKRKLADNKLFDGTLTEDVVLIPTRPGTYTLGAFEIHTFDPETGRYRSHRIAETTVTVTAATTATGTNTSINSATTSTPSDNDKVPTDGDTSSEATRQRLAQITKGPAAPPAAATHPEGLIREPISTSRVGRLPAASLGQVAVQAAIPFAAVAAAWLALALRRAQLHDPLRPRRAALAQIPTALAALRENPHDAQRLLVWQRLAAHAHGLAHAAPAASEIPKGPWRTLWVESERALYREKTPLPSDWLARAEAAHNALAKEIPGTAWTNALRKPNLLPWLVMTLALFLALTPQSGHASDQPAALNNKPLLDRIPHPKTASGDHAVRMDDTDASAKRSGAVGERDRRPNEKDAAHAESAPAEAEAHWQAAVTGQPNDWAARQQLAFALAQQDRWGEAAAHATAAFVQNPRDEIARWNLSIMQAKAGYASREIAPALGDGPRALFAQLASPSGWDCAVIGGASLVALALLLPLLRTYGLLRRSVIAKQSDKPGLQQTLGAAHEKRLSPLNEARTKKGAAPLALGIIGLLLIALSLFGRSHYGLAAHPRAAIVWRAGTLYSIPTEADTAQQTVSLSAGSIGILEKPFLGWAQLRFSNGQTGWVRQTELVSLWGT